MFLILFIVFSLVVSLVAAKCAFRTLINPLFVFVVVTSAQIILYVINLAFFEPLHFQTQLYLFLYLLSGLLGGLTAVSAFNVKRHKLSVRAPTIDKDKLKRSLKFIGLAGLLISILYAYNTLSLLQSNPLAVYESAMDYRNDVMFGDLAEARGKFIPLLALSAINIGCILAPIYWVIMQRATFIVFLPLGASVIYSIVIMGRTHLVESFFLFAFSLAIFGNLYSSIAPQIVPRRIFIKFFVYASLALSLLIFGMTAITGKSEWSSHHPHTLIDGLPFIAQLYDYFTISLSRFNDVSIHDSPEYSLGWSSFRPLMYVLYKIGVFSTYSDTEYLFEDYWLPFYGNVSPAIRFFYEDFGVVGVFVIPYLFMLISCSLQIQLARRFSFGKFAVLISFVLAFFGSTGVWTMWYQHFYLVLLVAFIIQHRLSGPRRFMWKRVSPEWTPQSGK